MPCASCTPDLLPSGVACDRCGATPPSSQTEAALFRDLVGGYRSLEGLGGWLILVGIRLVLAPLLILRTMFSSNFPLLMKQTYQPYFEKHPMLHGLLLLEIATNICFLAVLAALLYLFFKKKRAFPTYAILYMVFYALVMAGDALVIHVALPGAAATGVREIGNSAATAAIWIPYFLVSRRVKATFIN